MRRMTSIGLLGCFIAFIPTSSHAQEELIPFQADGWRYLQVRHGELPTFSATAEPPRFNTGQAPFGSGGDFCPESNTVNSGWSVNRDMLLRRTIDLPRGTTDVRVSIAIDNDFVLFWNGVQVNAQRRDGCATEFVVPIPAEMVTQGTNLLAIRATDRGGESFVDARITAMLPPPLPPEGPFGDPICSDGLDNDEDGFTDASDSDCAPPREGPFGDGTCEDNVDNDGDGFTDASDIDCAPPTEGPFGDASCRDGLDNDGDGLFDINDPDCQPGPEGVPGSFTCNDNVDNDEDGLIDINDRDCQQDENRFEGFTCQDGVDNDGDRLIDGNDEGCQEEERG